MNPIYKSEPIDNQDGIPIFSKSDYYIENYSTIAKDHLSALRESGCNPFIKEHLWIEIENSTECLIKDHLLEGNKILDVGVGTGRLLEKFPTADRYGLDISLDYLGEAQEKGIEVCLSKVEDMPYADESFDMIVTTDVLEHVIDLNFALRKIFQALKVKGILIVRVPFKEDLSSYLADDYPYDLVHLRTFDEYGLRLTVEKIFRHQTLNHTLTGYTGGRPRIPLPKKFKLRSAFARFLSYSRFTGKSTHLQISKVTRKPTEINFVFKKLKHNNTLDTCAE